MCSIEGCEGRVVARGWCESHYRRWKRHGDPTLGEIRGLSIEQRFWAKVDKTGDCWVWTGATVGGYGTFWDGTYRHHRKPHLVRAHRWSFMRFVRPVEDDVEVCHTCDNPPPCVRPDHLFEESHTDNMRDSSSKGRQRGNSRERNGKSKLTEAEIAAIRSSATGRYGEVSEIARRYGITSSTVSKILKGHIWV